MANELQRQFQNLMTRTNNFGLIARHLGCEKTALIAYYEGSENALTVDEKLILGELILDLFSGKSTGGFFLQEDGNIGWSSK